MVELQVFISTFIKGLITRFYFKIIIHTPQLYIIYIRGSVLFVTGLHITIIG